MERQPAATTSAQSDTTRQNSWKQSARTAMREKCIEPEGTSDEEFRGIVALATQFPLLNHTGQHSSMCTKILSRIPSLSQETWTKIIRYAEKLETDLKSMRTRLQRRREISARNVGTANRILSVVPGAPLPRKASVHREVKNNETDINVDLANIQRAINLINAWKDDLSGLQKKKSDEAEANRRAHQSTERVFRVIGNSGKGALKGYIIGLFVGLPGLGAAAGLTAGATEPVDEEPNNRTA